MMKSRVAYNMAVLTLTGIITKTMDFVFRAYYSKQLGAEGMGIFSLIMSIFGVILSLSSAGMGVAVSRLVSINEERGDSSRATSVVKTAVLTVCCIGAVCTTVVFISAEWISEAVLADIRCAPGLLCIAPASIFMGISYCIKGYFYGVRRVFIPASSEFIEQAVKICAISLFLDKGLYMGTEYGCAGVLLGITAGEFCSCVYLCLQYKFRTESTEKDCFPVRNILAITLPMVASAVGNSFFRMIEDVWIINGFEKYGEENAVGVYGLIKGMTMPLLIFPLNLISSFMALLVPEVSRAEEKGRLERVVKRVGDMGIFFGILVFVVFYIFAEELSVMVYGGAEAAKYIKPFAWLCPVMVIDSLSNGMLGGLGKQKNLLIYSLADTVLRLSMVYFFLPEIGNPAIIAMIILSNLMTCKLTSGKIRQKSGGFVSFSNTFKTVLLGVAVIFAGEEVIPHGLSGGKLILAIVAVVAVYIGIYRWIKRGFGKMN